MAFVKERGTIAVMSEVQSGTSQSGNTWSRQTIVVDVVGYNGNYRKVMLQASGNVVADLETMMVGDKVEITYQVTAREWNGVYRGEGTAACRTIRTICSGISAESAAESERKTADHSACSSRSQRATTG